jgi:hypothetical protein
VVARYRHSIALHDAHVAEGLNLVFFEVLVGRVAIQQHITLLKTHGINKFSDGHTIKNTPLQAASV